MKRLLLIAGTAIVLLALLANTLGMDPKGGWGKTRLIILGIGLLGIALGAGMILIEKYRSRLLRYQVYRWAEAGSLGLYRTLTGRTGEVIVTILVVGAISGYALWYVTAGHFPAFPKLDNMYAGLGESLLHGQVSMPEKPDLRLVILQNPYDNNQWKGLNIIWDYSYYKGQYYIYWGPVPALAFAAYEALAHVQPPGQLVPLLTYIGLAIVLAWVLIELRRRFFPRAPFFSVGLFTAVSLMNVPVLFLIARPSVYETSIIAGQFFLWLGFLAWLIYTRTERTLWLALAGLGWGLAVGSRYNMALSVGVFVVFGAYWLCTKLGWRTALKRGIALAAPLALMAVMLGLYNYARFGNPLETGQSYQLSNPVYEHRYYSPAYIPSNVFSYFLYPPHVWQNFPFFRLVSYEKSMAPAWAEPPLGKIFDEVAVGMLFYVPFIWLLALGSIPGAAQLVRRKREVEKAAAEPRWIDLGMIFGAGLVQLLLIMMFFAGAMRYADDFLPALLLTAVFCLWKLDELLGNKRTLRVGLWGLILAIGLATVMIGYLSGFDIPPNTFRINNHDLYNHLGVIWNARFAFCYNLAKEGKFLQLLGRLAQLAGHG